MAIYSCNISNVSRASGSSSCATLSYISAEKVYDERLGQTFSFGREERVEHVATLVPTYAPKEYQDPKALFNSIEQYEKADNARTAKKIIVALPREFDLEKQKEVLESYIEQNLTSKGYACTYAIHNDQDNNNPHAHILVANRQLDKNGNWSAKRKMEYVLDEHGERVPVIDQATGLQKVDKQNRKQWKRVSVEQNPLDKKEMLEELRESWAKECNKYLEKDQQIDHRSYEEQGIERIPTIHEGYQARALEQAGWVSERCEYNREVKEQNSLLEMLQHSIDKLMLEGKELVEKTKQKARDISERLQQLRTARATNGHAGRNADGNREPQADERRAGIQVSQREKEILSRSSQLRRAEQTVGTSEDVRELVADARAGVDRATAKEENSRTERNDREVAQERLNRERERAIKQAERSAPSFHR